LLVPLWPKATRVKGVAKVTQRGCKQNVVGIELQKNTESLAIIKYLRGHTLKRERKQN